MEKISIKYNISLQEFMEAYESHWKAHKMGTKSNVITSLVGMIIGVCFLFNYFTLGVIIAISSLILLTTTLLRNFLYKRSYENSPKYSQECNATFTGEIIYVENAAGKSELKWNIYKSYLESTRYILIYMGKNSFSIIPKSAFKSEEEIDNFKSMLNKNIKR